MSEICTVCMVLNSISAAEHSDFGRRIHFSPRILVPEATEGFEVWAGLDWTGMDWIGLGWPGLDWTGLEWTGLDLSLIHI